ncbi:major facilitator superfamily domain-containing protein [Nemania serpens]|nr:major facilitator superfamily domain-containing protein [Nemania serpens]
MVSPTADTWTSLPHKDQLAVLTLCRIVDFFQMVSFQTICYYQLKSFDSSSSEQVLFTAVQSCTAIPWGYVADAKWGGRKNVLLIGLLGTSLSCVGVALSTSFAGVVIFRALGGAANGTVGVVRTMMSEVIQYKRHQSRAFLLLPVSFSMAALIGPEWLQRYPYSLPSLLSALLLVLISVAVILVLQEVYVSRQRHHVKYTPLLEVHDQLLPQTTLVDHIPASGASNPRPKLPFYRIWTSNVVLTMVSQAFFEFYLGAFGSAWALLLSSPEVSAVTLSQNEPVLVKYLQAGSVYHRKASVTLWHLLGWLVGLLLQFLFYPAVHRRCGTLKCYRLFSLLFPVVYALSPILLFTVGSPVATWIGLLVLLFIHSTGRIFCVPASITLLNNCSPHPSVLGIVHGIGQATSSAFRTIGPVCAGYLHGISLADGIFGLS